MTVKLFFNVQPVAAYFLCPVFLFTGLQSVRAFRNLKANPEVSFLSPMSILDQVVHDLFSTKQGVLGELAQNKASIISGE